MEKIATGKMTIDQFGVQAVDDYTLQVTIEGPTTYFPLLASTRIYYPVPKHVIQAKGNQWVEAGNIVSNGPFVMTEWRHDQKIVLAPNPKYYGDKPTLTRTEYLIYHEVAMQSSTPFENNELDHATPQGADLDRVLADPKVSTEIVQFEHSNCYFVVCDTTNPPTGKAEFRQARSKSIGRRWPRRS